ncbi:hypothetical protein Tsubulata_032967 [Turnera subulata]|uniref:F-box domain-containing protein n=1 Tax=Turnera subulata TaxID=218843 RepID=A0A9Q0J9T2_9ROSI|nr:hypothetical protein Tsubulata_032967 [Turnera subulata]
MNTFLRLLQNQRKRHKKKKHRRYKEKACSFSFLDDLLGDELLEQILCRLDFKTIHQCKSVCKRWLSLISSPEFIDRYVGFQQSLTPISSRFYLAFDLEESPWTRRPSYRIGIGKTALDFRFVFKPKPPPHRSKDSFFELVGSWNGLLLLVAKFQNSRHRPRYYVCNPITKDWVALPPAPLSWQYGQAAAFIDDEESITTTEEGGRRGFKVVVVGNNFDGAHDMSIFTSSTGEWWRSRRVMSCKAGSCFYPRDEMVCCNRILYWDSCPSTVIVQYDPYKVPPPDECSYINLPPEYKRKSTLSSLCMGVNQGRILICDHYLCQRPLCIWELQDCTTSSWCLKHKFVLDSVLNVPHVRCSILAFHPIDGDIVFLKRLRGDSVISLNMRTKQVSLSIRGHGERAYPFFLPWWQTRLPDLNNLKQT